MSDLYLCLGQVAPYYNLLFVLIVVFLYVKLFLTRRQNRKAYLLPWYCIFAALCVYIVEEIITVLRAMGILTIPVHINGFFELTIIILFIYALLSQREHIKEVYRKVKKKVKKSHRKVKKRR